MQRQHVARRRVNSDKHKKNWTFIYSFELNGCKYRVCKDYFLSTLNISAKRIYYFFKTVQNPLTNIPRSPNKGNNGKRAVPVEAKDLVRKHINSFNCVESHYCRANTNKRYLDPSLNVSRMYDLYIEWLPKEMAPVKKSMYSHIFNTEFNLAFHRPKKDLCDKCEEFKKIQDPSEEVIRLHDTHLKNKTVGRNERNQDRQNKDNKTAIITFDLENVFALPKINVSNAFYKKKLNCYNLTGHCNINGITYCSIWHECISGRAGNHLASALVKILINVMKDNNDLTKIILWSDSCVPQNKNSIMSMALQIFLQSNESKNLEVIEQKFSEPGHGNLQEIDTVHSVIERFLRPKEIMSPVSLIKLLTQLPKTFKTKLKVLQMNFNDFKDYQKISLNYVYNTLPYTKVKQIVYRKNHPFSIAFRNSFEDEFENVHICKYKTNKHTKKEDNTLRFPEADRLSQCNVGLRKDKKDNLASMLKYMDGVDLEYFQHLLKNVQGTSYNQSVQSLTSVSQGKNLPSTSTTTEDVKNTKLKSGSKQKSVPKSKIKPEIPIRKSKRSKKTKAGE